MSRVQPWYLKRPIAHRGLHSLDSVDENSFEAFSHAMELGYPIECDVQLTADDELVVHHDANTYRMTGYDYEIGHASSDTITAMKTHRSDYSIMRLDELLEQCQGKVPLLIELKATKEVKRLAHATRKTLKHYQGEYALQSFDPFVLTGLRMMMPGQTLGLLSGSFSDYELPKYQELVLKKFLSLPFIKPDFIALELCRGQEKLVKWLRKRYPLLGWTVDDKADLEYCRKSFDNIIFEFIDPSTEYAQ